MTKHQQMVSQLVKSGSAILAELTPEKVNAWHAATGIAGEAGEIIDAVKKVAVYNKAADRDNLVEELGDMEFYLEQLRQACDITREETLKANIKKLSIRYPAFKYTNERAHARADKQ